jgi:hypothetical protein
MFYGFDRYKIATLIMRAKVRFQCGDVAAFNQLTAVGFNAPIRVHNATLRSIDGLQPIDLMEPFQVEMMDASALSTLLDSHKTVYKNELAEVGQRLDMLEGKRKTDVHKLVVDQQYDDTLGRKRARH